MISIMNRREFSRKAVAGAAAAGISPMILTGNSWRGANDRVNVAVIGIRAQGQSHIQEYTKLKDVNVTAICDVDSNLFDERINNLFIKKELAAPKTYTDLRKCFEDKDVDAVSIATPNHWHALAAVWALQAGKHVSVEKPCCYNFFEGQKLVEAADKYSKLIIQDGAEQRSNPCSQSMAEYLHGGNLGEVYMAKGLCYKWRDTIGKTPEEPVPAGVDYDLWTGPAPKKPFSKNRFHYNWHWNWEYGNGDMGNQGVHEMDIARWGLGVKLPTRVTAMGGHFMFDDDQNTPNDLIAIFEFPNPNAEGDKKKILQFEVRHWITNREGIKADNPKQDAYMVSADNVIGNLFYGSKGFMTKNVNEWQVYYGKERKEGEKGSGLGNHYQAFIDAIRSGDRRLANADIRDGFYSCALMHLGNISYRLGRSLEFDPVNMKFINAPDADAMLTRKEYRKPFVFPEHI